MSATCDLCSRVLGPPPTHARSRVERLGRKSSHRATGTHRNWLVSCEFWVGPVWPDTPTGNINGVSV